MAVTSVTLGGLEVCASASYALGLETLGALEAALPREARLVSLAGRPPSFVGSQPKEKPIPILVYMLGGTKQLRRAAFQALESASGSGNLVDLTWVAEGVTRRHRVHVDAFVPDGWFHRAAATATATKPSVVV